MKNPNTYTNKQRSLGGLNKPRREETFEEAISRFHDDRKGYVIAEGVTYTSEGERPWHIQHSTSHARRFDVVQGDKLIAKGNPRSLPAKWIRAKTRKAKEENVTYSAIGQYA